MQARQDWRKILSFHGRQGSGMTIGKKELHQEPAGEKASYAKPELREYGKIAELTASLGTSAMPDGGAAPNNMSVST
jgi:hypothetical protein